jgi:hypothetical protein
MLGTTTQFYVDPATKKILLGNEKLFPNKGNNKT